MFGVTTDIPPHQGLKSSSSISVAAIRALADHAGLDLTDERTVHLAVTAQRKAGVTLTGAVDDTWACATPMWHLVDVRNQEHPVILNSGEAPSQDHTLMIAIGGTPRRAHPDPDRFEFGREAFLQAYQALETGDVISAITWNGRGVAAVTSDHFGRQLANHAVRVGALASGISGSGPSVVTVIPNHLTSIQPSIQKRISSHPHWGGTLLTRFLNIDTSS